MTEFVLMYASGLQQKLPLQVAPFMLHMIQGFFEMAKRDLLPWVELKLPSHLL